MNFRRRDFLTAGSLGSFVLAFPRLVEATTLVGLELEELVRRSDRIVVGRAEAADASWEKVAGARRIVTRTRVVHEDVWATTTDDEGESEVLTLGGVVGDIAQKVSGEAALRLHQPCVLFLSPEGDHGRSVVGMAQGHYLVLGEGNARVMTRGAEPHAVGPAPVRWALTRLHLKPLAEARALVRELRR